VGGFGGFGFAPEAAEDFNGVEKVEIDADRVVSILEWLKDGVESGEGVGAKGVEGREAARREVFEEVFIAAVEVFG